MVLLTLGAESAQPMKRGDKKSKLAVMLAYRPNSEIKTRDRNNNSWTYKVEDESSDEDVNEQLLEDLIKDKFAKRVNGRKPVKRENLNDDECDSQEVDVAKIVELGGESDKKTCYKNTYKNVLTAFEKALKSQIENYKKCVCKKKTPTTTTTTTPTSAAPTTETDLLGRNLSDEDGDVISIGNENEIESALDHKDDIICFHRQYAFMLNKLLDRIPCASNNSGQNSMEQFNGDPVKRSERNNKFVEEYRDLDDDESVEIDVSEVTRKSTTTLKPKTTTVKPKTTSKPFKKHSKAKKTQNAEEKLNDEILATLAEHFKSKKVEKSVEKRSQKKLRMTPKKITIKQREIRQSEESEEKTAPEESQEISQQQFIQQLQELFQKYQVESDETFPLQSDEHSAESTSALPPRKSSKKSSAKNAVAESSDESIEAAIKLKNRKLEKERHQSSAAARKIPASRGLSHITHNSIDNSPKKSYRSSPRADDEANHSAEDENVRRNLNSHKKPHRTAKSSRTPADDRLAADFAKKISDFARSKSPKKLQ